MATSKKPEKTISGESRGTSKNKWYGHPPKEKRFSATRQPNRDRQLRALKDFHFGRKMIREIFKLKFKFPKNSKIQSNLIRAFGSEIVEANVGTIMIAVQCLKAIEKGDSNAFNALFNQAYGSPKIEMDLPQKMIVEVVHDDRELREGKNNKQYFPAL